MSDRDDRPVNVCRVLLAEGEATRADVCAELELTPDQAAEALSVCRDAGMIECEGRGRGARWRITRAGRAAMGVGGFTVGDW